MIAVPIVMNARTGIDYNLHYQPVLAAYPGEVIYADWSDRDNHRAGYGLYVKLEHKEGQADYETIYGRLPFTNRAIRARYSS